MRACLYRNCTRLLAAALLGASAAASWSQPVGIGARAASDNAPRYEAPRLLAPKSGETIHDNQGTVWVEVALQPPLRTEAGHRFRIRLDGRLVAGTWSATRFSLSDVERGTHTLQFVVVDAAGRELAASAPIEFNLWRASRLSPSRKNAP